MIASCSSSSDLLGAAFLAMSDHLGAVPLSDQKQFFWWLKSLWAKPEAPQDGAGPPSRLGAETDLELAIGYAVLTTSHSSMLDRRATKY